MTKLENKAKDSSEIVSRDSTKEQKKYFKENDHYEGFNPKYRVQEENFNINPLSARSCRCYPCKCGG